MGVPRQPPRRPERARLDVELVRRGLAPTREKASRLIMAGRVRVGGRVEDKPGTAVRPDSPIHVDPDDAYVSRGGWKLEHALQEFGLDVRGAVAMDVGASTGGFTDCLLRHGASRVFAVDVGHGQMDARLAADPRVELLERTNIRYLDPGALGLPLDVIVCDVSFISVTLFIARLREFLRPGGVLVVLVKPQFEAGREKVRKGGVVRSPEVHVEVLERVTGAAAAAGFDIVGVTWSPVRGPKGNIEYLLVLTRPAEGIGGRASHVGLCIRRAVDDAWRSLRARGKGLPSSS